VTETEFENEDRTSSANQRFEIARKDALLLFGFIVGLPIASYALYVAYLFVSMFAFLGSMGSIWESQLDRFAQALTAFNIVAACVALLAAAVGKLRAGLLVALALGLVAAVLAPIIPGFELNMFPRTSN
jgi:hypothetical protein